MGGFDYDGRTFGVVNHMSWEVILVDGERVKNTRLSGDWMTHATHAIALPDGQQLDIVIATTESVSTLKTALGELSDPC